MEFSYLFIVALLFTWGILKVYKLYFYKKYFYDKEYFWQYHAGFWMYVFIIFIIALDYTELKLLRYIFPLWGIAPTIFLRGVCRVIELKIRNNDYDDNDSNNLLRIKSALRYLYFCTLLLLLLYFFVIVDGRI